MAPGRKRGAAKGAKTKSQLSLGDLVLAKVKGFPAWPAKISKPEDWERTPDPKKYFVQFFGTEEIAFVAPADIQAFTSESKSKLSARCKGKTVKYFSQAVKEICDAFEELQQKNSGAIQDGNDGQAYQSDAHFTEVLEDGTSTDGPGGETDSNDHVNHGPGLERCSHIHGDVQCEDIKPSVSPNANDSSPLDISSQKRNEPPNDDVTSAKEEIISTTNAGHNRNSEAGLKAEANGKKSKKMVTDLKRKPEDNDGRQKIRSPAGVSSAGQTSLPESSENLKDGERRKISTHVSKNEAMVYPVKPEVIGNAKKSKKVVKDKTRHGGADELLKGSEGGSMVRKKIELSGEKVKAEHGHGKDNQVSNGGLHPTKRSKCSDDASKGSQTNRKSDLSNKGGNDELKRLKSRLKTENHLASKRQTSGLDSDMPGDEDALPPTKRRRRALDAMSSSPLISEDRIARSSITSKRGLAADAVKSPGTQVPMKRRAVRLCCDDDEDEPKTPVHGGSARKVEVISQISVPGEKAAVQSEHPNQDLPVMRDLGLPRVGSSKGLTLSTEQLAESLSPNPQQDITKAADVQVLGSPRKTESEKISSKEVAHVSASPSRSPLLDDAIAPKTIVEPVKANKSSGKVSGIVPQKKAQAGSYKGPIGISDSVHHSQTHSVSERSKPALSGERLKSTPKSSSRMTDSAVAFGKSSESNNLTSNERLEVGRMERASSVADSRSKDEKSMKHLIAVAQAKRRQAQSQNHMHDSIGLSHLSAIESTVRSPNAASALPSLSGPGVMVQPDVQGFYSQTSLPSPSSRIHQLVSNNQPDPAEFEETRTGSGHRPAGGSLSGGTEAAVARDAFEGMIETLSRTKESIGRATRLAIDCAKYGIANEVVELLIRKLENEPSFHRRVDLFFLVDSITQCSHSQKGIAGASYIPTVQAALPRLLGAAAPPGASARENRRQCLKVLRLWLERKILPDSLLRSYMDDIGASNDDTSAGFFPKRPSRSERAVDDPIREMEGMLVDEYGSNATFQLPGFLSSSVFEEEEEEDVVLNISHKESFPRSPVELNHSTGELETCSVTPSDRRHCILEDVDGELEMEDVSGHLKDERPVLADGSCKPGLQKEGSDRILDAASNNSNELSPFCEGSPPLPPGSPPTTPPLPCSPPPPLPSMLPPPPSSPSPPPPPPPPPPPQSQAPPLNPPHAVPPQSFPQPPLIPQPSLPLQPSLPPQPQMPPLQPMPPQTSTAPQHMLPYQPTLPSNVAVSTRLGPHGDAAVRGEMFPQQSSCFVQAVACSSREPSGFNSSRSIEYGHEAYTNSQGSQSNQQFQAGNIPMPQRPFQPPMLPQTAAGQYPYPKPAMPQHPQHAYPPPYALTKPPDGMRRYGADEQWRPPSNEFNADNQHGAWINGGRTSLSSGPPFPQEGFFRPPMERPPTINVGFQPSGMNVVPAGAPIPGHSGSLMMPSRPDMSSINSWRPA